LVTLVYTWSVCSVAWAKPVESSLNSVSQNSTQAPDAQAIKPLKTGVVLNQTIQANSVHIYEVSLQAGQYLKVIAEQRGVDVMLRLFSPDGTLLAESDSPNSTEGQEPISVIATVPGSYRIEVRPIQPDTSGQYRIRVAALQEATTTDQKNITAERAFMEAYLNLKDKSRQGALVKYLEALQIFQADGSRYQESLTLSQIGWTYWHLGEYLKAVSFYQQALAVFRELGDSKEEIETLNTISEIYLDYLKDYNKAIEFHQQEVLKTVRRLGDRKQEAALFRQIGETYDKYLEDYSKAIASYKKSLEIYEQLGDRENIDNLYALLRRARELMSLHDDSDACFTDKSNSTSVNTVTSASLSLIPSTQVRVNNLKENVLVNEIIIKGVEEQLKATIIKVVKTKVGQIASKGQLQQDAGAISNLGIFSNVQVFSEDTHSGTSIIFLVKPYPNLEKIRFSIGFFSGGICASAQSVIQGLSATLFDKPINVFRLNDVLKEINTSLKQPGTQFNSHRSRRALHESNTSIKQPNDPLDFHTPGELILQSVDENGTATIGLIGNVIENVYRCVDETVVRRVFGNSSSKILESHKAAAYFCYLDPGFSQQFGVSSGERWSFEVGGKIVKKANELDSQVNIIASGRNIGLIPGSEPGKSLLLIQLDQTLRKADWSNAVATFDLAEKLNEQGTVNSSIQAISKYQEAVVLFEKSSKDELYEPATLPAQFPLTLSYELFWEKKFSLKEGQVSSVDGSTFSWMDFKRQAEAFKRIAAIHLSLGNIYKALNYYDKARYLLKSEEAEAELAGVLINIADVYNHSLGSKEQGLNVYKQALEILTRLQNKEERIEREAANRFVAKPAGSAARSSAQMQDSKEQRMFSCQRWIQIAASKSTQSSILSAANFCLDDAGSRYARYEYPQALQHLNQALNLFQSIKDGVGEAKTLTFLAKTLNQMGKRSEAMEVYERSLTKWQAVGYPEQQSELLTSAFFRRKSLVDIFGQRADYLSATISTIYQNLEEYEEALESHQKRLLDEAKIPPGIDEANTLLVIGGIYAKLNQPKPTLRSLEQARSISRAEQHRVLEATTLETIASVHFQNLNNPKQALNYLNQAIALYQSTNSSNQAANTLMFAAFINNELRQTTVALTQLEQAQALLQSSGDRLQQLSALLLKGGIQVNQGNTNQAISTLKSLIDTIESLRDDIKVSDLKLSFISKQSDPYAVLITLFWQTGRYEEAFEYVERAKARAFLDQMAGSRVNLRAGATPDLIQREQNLNFSMNSLRSQLAKLKKIDENANLDQTKIAELQTKLNSFEKDYSVLLQELQIKNPEVASLRSVNISKDILANIQKQLDPETTLVEYYVTSERTFAFVITQDSFQQISLDNADSASLDNRISIFRANHKNKNDESGSSESQRALKDLHQWLIAPLQPHLKTRKLAIVPHGILHNIPFAALNDDKRYLVDDYALSLLPSGNVLQFLHKKPIAKISTLLALGNPKPIELAPLNYAESETKEVAALYGVKPLLGPEATESAVWSQAGNANILHLATHGQYNSTNPLFSTLLLGGKKATDNSYNDGRLEVREVYELDLKETNLVVLSACETAKGKPSNGDDIVGLSRAFLYAGTPSIITTLWSVDDEASGLLMQKFYKNLKSGMEKAEALRQAQVEIRSIPKYHNPYYWAAFTLTGDGSR
jgi:CHAT domain-containing protein